MKAAIVQSAAPSSPTANQDFTDGVFSSDVKGAIVFASAAIANGTIAEEARLSFAGIGDDAVPSILSYHEADNQNSTIGQNCRLRLGSTNTVEVDDAVTDTQLGIAIGSILTNGIRAGWTSWSGFNELVSALILGGTDVEVSCSAATLNGTTNVSVAHGLAGGAPHVIIALSHGFTAPGQNGAGCLIIGFHDVGNGTYAGVAQHNSSGVNTTAYTEQVFDNAIAVDQTGNTVNWRATINTVGATNFNVVASAASTDLIKFICIRVTNGVFKVGTFLSKAGTTGTQADITGMAKKPKVALYLTTHLTAAIGLNVISTAGTTCESFGVGAAVDNEGVTQVAASATWGDDNLVLGNPAPVTDTKSVTSSTKCGYAFNDAGTSAMGFTVSSWDAGGITHNHTDVTATARYVAYLAIAPEPAAVGTIIPILNTYRLRRAS